MSTPRVGVIGSGIVGRTLAAGFTRHGWETMIGSRDPEPLRDWADATTPRVATGTFAETANFGDLLVLAVRGSAAEATIALIGAQALAGKTILDATNPIAEQPIEDGVLPYFTDHGESLMERLQRAAPAARFVKAFSCVTSALMVDPEVVGGPPTMFICGNHDDAKREAIDVLESFGWDWTDLGSARAARAIEPLAMLMCIPGLLRDDWIHALRLLPR
jgi:predicted dinucleotide-binding enzyme